MQFAVLHDTEPTFGMGSRENPTYTVVARGLGLETRDDIAICEKAYHVTQTIECGWVELAETNKLYNVVVPSRSTSVGDVICIEEESGEQNVRYYRCDDIGWTKLSTPPALA